MASVSARSFPWTCTRGNALTCHLDDLARNASSELTLVFSDSATLVDVATTAPVVVSGPSDSASVALTVRSAPARYDVEITQGSTARAAIDAVVNLINTGRTSEPAALVAVDLPAGFALRGGPDGSDDWTTTCPVGALGDVCRPVDVGAGAAVDLDLRLVAPRGDVAAGEHPIQVRVGGTAAASSLRVSPAPADLSGSTVLVAPDAVENGHVATITADVVNSGEAGASATVAIVLPPGLKAQPNQGWTESAGRLTLPVEVPASATVSTQLLVRNVNPGSAAAQQDVEWAVEMAGSDVVAGRYRVTLGEATPTPTADFSASSSTMTGTDPLAVGDNATVAVTLSNAGSAEGTATAVVTVPDSMNVTEATGWTAAGNELRQTVTVPAGDYAELRPIHLQNVNASAVAQAVDVGVRAEVAGTPVYETSHTMTLQPPAAPAIALGVPTNLTVKSKAEVPLPLTVTNGGTAKATGVHLSVDLPADVTFQSFDGASWTCHPPLGPAGANGTVTCDLGQNLAAGASIPITLRVAAGNGADGKQIVSWIDYDGPRVTDRVPTAVSVTDQLPACAPGWTFGAYYEVGATASYMSVNYERTFGAVSYLPPPSITSRWTFQGPCA